MDIAVLASAEAKRLEEQAARGLPVAEARLMRAIVRRLHGRHIGITPELAVALARLLTAPPVRSVLGGRSITAGAAEAEADQARQVGAMPWSAALERMSLLHDPGGNARLMPHFAPWWVVTRLVAPLVWKACETIGRSVVFGAEALGSDSGRASYQDYAARLRREVTALVEAQDDEGMPELFWHELAHSLAGLMKRQSSSRGAADGGLPQIDPANLALMLRLPLRETRKRNSRKVVARRAMDAVHRSGIHPQMMGVTGIRVASGVDEVDRMLSSEWLNPPMILADRLMNTGFLATDRPPPQQHRRDMMVIGLSLLPAADGGAGALVRTAYVEAMRRLVPLLVQAEQRDSRCVWMELGQLGGINAQGFSFEKVVAMAARAGGMRGGADAPPRDRFIAGMGFLPDFLDDHQAYPPRLLPPEALTVDIEQSAGGRRSDGQDDQSEALSLAGLRGAERWAEMALDRLSMLPGFSATEANPASYSTLHLLAFLPEADGVEDAALVALQRRLEAKVKGAGMAGRAASLVVVPTSGESPPMRRIRSLLLPAGTTTLSTTARATEEGRAAAFANDIAEFATTRIEEAMLSG